MVATAPSIRYTAREFITIKDALSDYIKATYPDLWTDFFESNLGVVLMEIIAYTGDILSFTIDRVAQEVILSTCKRYSSALRFAKSVGYRPAGPTSASVDITITDYVTTPTPAQVTIPSGTRVAAGSLSFETIEDYVFAPGLTGISFPVVEGSETSDTFVSDGSANQRYDSVSEQVADLSWSIIVNGVEWVEVANLLSAQKDDVYKVNYTTNSKIEVVFGDGIYGNRPTNNDLITLTYRITKGSQGNITGNAIAQQITAVVGSLGRSITVTNLLAAAGGADRESLDHLKAFIPQWIKAVDKAISYNDYVALANDYSGIAGSVGKASVNLRDSGTGPRIIGYLNSFLSLPDGSPGNPYPPVGSLYVIKDIDSAAPSGWGIYQWAGALPWTFITPPLMLAANIVDIYVWAPTADAFGGITFTNASIALKDELMAFFDGISVVTVRVCAQDGIITPVNVDLGTVYVNSAYELVAAQAAVETALSTHFSREAHKPGSTIYLSDIYEAVNDVNAVERFDLTVPAADTTAAFNELLVLGTITATYATEPAIVPNVSGTCP